MRKAGEPQNFTLCLVYLYDVFDSQSVILKFLTPVKVYEWIAIILKWNLY